MIGESVTRSFLSRLGLVRRYRVLLVVIRSSFANTHNSMPHTLSNATLIVTSIVWPLKALRKGVKRGSRISESSQLPPESLCVCMARVGVSLGSLHKHLSSGWPFGLLNREKPSPCEFLMLQHAQQALCAYQTDIFYLCTHELISVNHRMTCIEGSFTQSFR